MTDTASNGRRYASSSDDRNLAFVSYGLLFAAPFVFGLTALIAVVIAYVRKPEAVPMVRSHFRFQIQAFWVSFALSIIAAVALMTGFGFFVADMVGMMTNDMQGWDAWRTASYDAGDLRFHSVTLMGVAIFLFCYISAGLWAMLSSVYGMVRLGGQKPVGGAAL